MKYQSASAMRRHYLRRPDGSPPPQMRELLISAAVPGAHIIILCELKWLPAGGRLSALGCRRRRLFRRRTFEQD